ncbi:hypothetical protein MesoLj131b_69440 (plasmid) [Mesorhizobium sp. 131-2-5]|uniref:glycoside hydrolase family 75 protein n=1 Tax=Mesorhizobium sp. 131-2-5 TaxID=2744519 RepID=UPI001925B6FC|nr:glycoside hydrolase family 75 protein [Mesorhizobium sp. 131-2-5]BCH04945.1 hypothetical protein MesoLj131b_69440 [Mesorhizobium sp. 131-2-5]
MTHVDIIGSVCTEWDYAQKSCVAQVDVRLVQGSKSPFFVSKLAVDADGAPMAYHPGDTGSYDYLANVSKNDLHGIQGEDGAVGPAPGFYVSGTSLSDPAYGSKDTRHWVDAAKIPYFVLNRQEFPQFSVPLGSIATVVDLNSRKRTGAILADTGHAVGEGSIALAVNLGLSPFSKKHPPKVVGFDEPRFLYLLYPDRTVDAPWAVGLVQSESEAGFRDWGGDAQLDAIFPKENFA